MKEKKLLHMMTKAVKRYDMIKPGSSVLVCLSGGKDSYTMLKLLNKMRIASGHKFNIHSLTLDQGQPGWDDSKLKNWLITNEIKHTILKQDTYKIVTKKIPEDKTYCALCSRLRRGIIYSFASTHNFDIIALGHHRQDAVESLLMSILYNGTIQSMPPKLLTNDKKNIVIRPMIFCDEQDIISYARSEEFPIIPCNLCGSQSDLMRNNMKKLLRDLQKQHPNIISNAAHSLQSVKASQLHDDEIWDFSNLERG